jgi:hypothetical protein
MPARWSESAASSAAAASSAPGAHWNQYVTPEVRATELTVPDATLESLRQQGFAIARVLPGSGILRGTTDLRILANPLRIDGERLEQSACAALGADNEELLGKTS